MLTNDVLNRIKSEYGTPAYIFDCDVLERKVNFLENVFGKEVSLCYAMKANPLLVDEMKKYNVKYEVCSPGEFSICEREKIDMERIVLSGVYKSKEDMEHVFSNDLNIGMFTVESLGQLELIEDCAKKYNKKVSALLRVTSGNQFGMDESVIESIISSREQYPYVDIKGIQCYTGTQKKKSQTVDKEIEWLDAFCDRLKEKYGYVAEELEYGPGLTVNYFIPEVENDDSEYISTIASKIKSISQKYKITLEIGRFLVADCGTYVTQIVDLKKNNDVNYCIVDGGINHINYYGQTLAMKTPKVDVIRVSDNDEGEWEEWNICGSLCTVGDVLMKKFKLCNAQIGDMLVFKNIGAYSITEGIYLFLSRKMPKVLTYSDKQGLNVIRKEIPSDLINSRDEVR